jgi:hypothetical protein
MNDTPTPRTDERKASFALDTIRQLETELTAVTEQRDELLRYNEAFRKETLICADCDSISKEEYDQAIEQRDKEREIYQKSYSAELARSNHYKHQRDRLAEALKIITGYPSSDEYIYSTAEQALQSLTTKEQ